MRQLLQHRHQVLTLGLLYFSQGIPIGIAMDALPTLLRHDGASLQALAFLPLVGLPWVVKFLWAPLVDNHWSPRFGRRRSWIIPLQCVVTLCLILLSAAGISAAAAGLCVALLAVASLASATQDIATDGMAAEHVSGELLSRVNAIQIAGVMSGFFVGGAGMMMLSARVGVQGALLAMAIFPAVSLLAIGRFRQHADLPPERADSRPASLLRTLRRRGAARLLTLTLLSAVTAVSGFGLAKLFLTDHGWTPAQVGQIGMAGGMVTLVLGCGGGAWLVSLLGVWKAFAVGLGCALCASLCWLAMANWGLQSGGVIAAVMGGALASGVTSVAIMTAGMQFAAQGDQAGTDMTMVQSSRDIGEMVSNMLMVGMTASLGYRFSFALAAALAVLLLGINLASNRHPAAVRRQEE
ncbi:RhtX/FptX family siderophore transporter [Serratia marcescens]|uniref:RhtX/FptX family siderophore transporter n=1 Tax=Serratia marcescens TaxID=615 RepID=UPI0027E44769|nr:RhtX/FptX family siderophore transporter [Serratia marcescens]MDI3228928.1 RhtX/FptX family siderophore transporter [Serratia marcescens]HEN7342065.1 RhtX/FptX family siderophore transporter [Serratia marcescens]HEN7410374.1 RhtX/FptX family siderophore transporter [Serratia marcescens]